MRLFEQGVRTDLLEQLQRVVNSIRPWVFAQVLSFHQMRCPTVSLQKTYLIKRTDWCQENNGGSIIEVRNPGVSLAPSTAHVV